MTKRATDILLGSALLIMALPLMLLVGAVVFASLGRPVFFTQLRPGLQGRPFSLVKFRTMTEAVGNDGRNLPDDKRLGRIGRFLRQHSLDELPELWNVIRGEMSLVGPRPLLPEYLPLYSKVQSRRHDVKPGLTGMAQVYGRNALSWEEKFALDVWYVDHRDLTLDLKLIALTILQVFRPRGVSMAGHATMPPFTGNEKQ